MCWCACKCVGVPCECESVVARSCWCTIFPFHRPRLHFPHFLFLFLAFLLSRTQVFEFIDGVHTAKNVMITAIKKDKPPRCAYLSECACAHVFWRVRLQSFLFFYPFKIHTRAYLSGELCARCHLLVHVASKNSYLDACPLFARRRLLVNAAVKNSCWSCGSGWQHSWHFMASVYNDLQCTSGRIPRIQQTRATCIRCLCAAACVRECFCVPCCA
jgi:hypothetical protein